MADEVYEKWLEVSIENFTASGLLLRERKFRSSVNRAYYAGYSRLTASLVIAGLAMPNKGNPSHRKLPTLILNNLHRMNEVRRRNLVGVLLSLYDLRTTADYQPLVNVDKNEGRIAAGLMQQIFRAAKEADHG